MSYILQAIIRNKAILLFLLFSISAGFFTTLTAQTNTYNGTSGGNWNTAGNWSLGLVPTIAHDVVIPNNKDVFVDTAAVCNSFAISATAGNNAINIGENSLTVTGTVTIGAPTANNKIKSINITTGSLTCASIIMGDTGGTTRVCAINTTSGTITVTGNITMNGAAVENQLHINGTLITGGTLNVGGSLSGGDFMSANLNSTINFNGTAAQIIPVNTSYTFNKVNINNIAGATLQAVITVANVTDNISVLSGIFDNGGFSIAGNPLKTFTVANGSTFKVSGTTSSFASGFLTNTLGATSTVEYSGTGVQTLFDIASPGYGNFVISNNAIKTAAGSLDIQGNVTINQTATFNASTFIHNIGGNWINNGTFTAGTSTINFNGTSTGKTISGTITGETGKFNNLTFNGVGGSWTIASDLDIANTLTVTNGTVGMSGVLSVAGTSPVTVASGGNLTLENNASLIQSEYTGANSGNINVKRNTTPIILNDYTYWSSPTSGTQTLLQFSPNTQTNKFFTFHNGWTYAAPAADIFAKGIGYALLAPEGISSTVPEIVVHQFTGVPNNGNVDVAVSVGPPISNRLIGNPYPSAIDADAFILANIAETGTINQTISGTLYFWTHNHGLSGGSYSASDYSTYNITGGTAVATGTGNTTTPTGYIPSGQGFFVHTLVNGNVRFDNSMRTGVENSNFNKTTNAGKTTTALEKNRIWLNLTNSTDGFSQALVGYIETATNNVDPGFDGLYYGSNKHVLYSLIDNNTYTIQARTLPFTDTDIVPLGFKVSVAGNTTISIDHVDGLFLDNQNIYLEDQLLNITHDLKQAPYTFSSEEGTFNNRFVLRYVSSALDSENFNFSNGLTVASKNKVITIKSQTELIEQVVVYDILGRLVYDNKKVNSNEILISDLMSGQALIIKTVLANGKTVNKKLAY